MTSTPFKIHDLKIEPPSVGQANDAGQVLFWSRTHGWYMGFFQSPCFGDTTSWTYAPQPLSDQKADRVEILETHFKKLIEEKAWGKDGKLEPWQQVLMRLAFIEGANCNL